MVIRPLRVFFVAEQPNHPVGDETDLRKVPLGTHDAEEVPLGSHGELDLRKKKQPEASVKDWTLGTTSMSNSTLSSISV